MYINSDKPKGRKRAEVAIPLAPHQALFLRKTCFLDTTEFPDLSQRAVDAAMTDPKNRLGPLAPFIRSAVVNTVRNYGVLEPERRQAVLAGEP